MFGQQEVNFNAVNGVRVTLYLFKPQIIQDFTRRSHVYKFSDSNMSMQLFDNVTGALNGMPQTNITTLMLPSTEAKSAVLPSATGDFVTLSKLSEYWKFLLIIDNEAGVTPMDTMMSSRIPTRTMCFGMVVGDEPVSSMFGKHNLNPFALYTIQHFTKLAMNQAHGFNGTYIGMDVINDYNIVHPDIAETCNANMSTLFDNRPHALSSSVIADPTMQGSFSNRPVAISGKKPLVVDTELSSPTHHLGTVVRGMVDSMTSVVGANNYSLNYGSASDVIMDTFSSLTASGTVAPYFAGIDPTDTLTGSDLMSRYGDAMEVVVVNQNSTPSYDLSGDVAPTKRNVFTSVISGAMPFLMVTCGLSDISFRYNSSVRDPLTATKGIFTVQNIASINGSTDNNYLQRSWSSFEGYIRNTVFPIIQTNCGEFDLTVYSSVGGISLVDLKLLDEMPEGGFIETNNMLGGLNSQLIGDMGVVNSNSSELYSTLTNIASSVGTYGLNTY